jgi:peptide/nickel transport system permease protein
MAGRSVVRYGEWLGVIPGWTYIDRGRRDDGPLHRAGRIRPRPRCAAACCRATGVSRPCSSSRSQIIAERLGADRLADALGDDRHGSTSLLIGVLSGMREGSRLDRGLSIFSIASTATPEYVSGVVLIALFASTTTGISPWLAEHGWITGKTLFMGTATSALDSHHLLELRLPVMTIALYGIGYIARMTRASMTEVMTAQYIRTARLKGVASAVS